MKCLSFSRLSLVGSSNILLERLQGLQGNKLTDVIKISYNLKGKVTNENTQALSNEQTNDFDLAHNLLKTTRQQNITLLPLDYTRF